MPTPLFVYGTLTSLGSKHHLLKSARAVGHATIAGRLFDLGRYPGVVRDSSRGRRVFGELYEIPANDAPRVLQKLDKYEGAGYDRKRAFVTLKSGRRRIAWVYVLRRKPTKIGQELFSGRYRKSRGAA
ncbi:MAG: gamma-glutamylcyclotransferase family protein [Gemmatimonadota bacterium]